ncbi:MAG: STAS domain-containing protein [Spirochaetes bacterium]|nr:STAS domain-containing protein [Spirochaetota bacterium]
MHSHFRTRHVFAIMDITGEITFEEAHLIEERAIKTIPDGFDHVVLNMTSVTRIDSAALAVLLKISKKLAEKDKTLILMKVNDQVKNVMKITGTFGQFRFVPDEETLMRNQSREEVDDFLGSAGD